MLMTTLISQMLWFHNSTKYFKMWHMDLVGQTNMGVDTNEVSMWIIEENIGELAVCPK